TSQWETAACDSYRGQLIIVPITTLAVELAVNRYSSIDSREVNSFLFFDLLSKAMLCFRSCCALLLLVIADGCGNRLPQTVQVSGRVTFDGQAPPGPGTVYFLPQEAAKGFPSRPATGDFDRAGYFKAKTFEPDDGLMPGKYTMHVECYETPPNMEGKPVKSYVPSKYQSAATSGFELEITP